MEFTWGESSFVRPTESLPIWCDALDSFGISKGIAVIS